MNAPAILAPMVLIAALAGCAQAPLAAACDPIDLSVSAGELRVGEQVNFTWTQRNCTGAVLKHHGCVPFDEARPTTSVDPYVYTVAQGAAEPLECRDTPETYHMAPGASSTWTGMWNGTFRELHDCDVGTNACERWSAAAPGAYVFTSTVANVTERVTVRVLGDA